MKGLSDMFAVARITALFTCAAVYLFIGVTGLRSAKAQGPIPAAVVNPIEYEHRVTSLESTVRGIADVQALMAAQLSDLRNTKWLELIALSALMGETGMRTFKGRFKKEGE